MAKHLQDLDFCDVRFHAEKIAAAGAAGYWLYCEGAGFRLDGQRDQILMSLKDLAAVMGLRLVDADPAPRPLPTEADA